MRVRFGGGQQQPQCAHAAEVGSRIGPMLVLYWWVGAIEIGLGLYGLGLSAEWHRHSALGLFLDTAYCRLPVLLW
jgi:hypothetical protein